MFTNLKCAAPANSTGPIALPLSREFSHLKKSSTKAGTNRWCGNLEPLPVMNTACWRSTPAISGFVFSNIALCHDITLLMPRRAGGFFAMSVNTWW